MALLSLAAIDQHHPERLLRSIVYGLKAPYDFVSGSIRRVHEQKPKAGWVLADFPDAKDKGWVRLTIPGKPSDLPDTVLNYFMDDLVEQVKCQPQNAPGSWSKPSSLGVLARDKDQGYLQLDPLPPEGAILSVEPNMYQLMTQLRTIRCLQNEPHKDHDGLLRLLEAKAHWPAPNSIANPEWLVLTDGDRVGVNEQRQFVCKALATPDIALLEGPPGSGKTTVICELILQMALLGKRVMLCASTHVAVDNVLERLMSAQNAHRDLILPIRIGQEDKILPEARQWMLGLQVQQELKRLVAYLSGLVTRDPSQQALLSDLRSSEGSAIVERMLLNTTNLVCGSTIGILQHPDLKNSKGLSVGPPFDMLIVDEASKTTFQEFLVPAIYAKRWVLVGDPKQLSPFIDDGGMAAALEACLPDADRREAVVDSFLARKGKHGATVVLAQDRRAGIWQEEAAARGIMLRTAEDPDAALADIVTGTAADFEGNPARIPIDVKTIRGATYAMSTLSRRHAANGGDEGADWAAELSWRMASIYGLRGQGGKAGYSLQKDCDDLLPVGANEDLKRSIDLTRRVAFPSVLETLRSGFERSMGQSYGNALSDGIPPVALEHRHTLLSWQHRMHPDIAEFARNAFYENQALLSSARLADRPWGWRPDEPRLVWQDVRGRYDSKQGNQAEVAKAMSELDAFRAWAATNPPPDAEYWEVAVLTPYRAQERALRNAMGKRKNGRQGQHYNVDICTIDRFQGREADLVILSFANTRGTHFLRAPNRLNVAVTRARHRLTILGDREGLGRAEGALGKLAKRKEWGTTLNEGGPT